MAKRRVVPWPKSTTSFTGGPFARVRHAAPWAQAVPSLCLVVPVAASELDQGPEALQNLRKHLKRDKSMSSEWDRCRKGGLLTQLCSGLCLDGLKDLHTFRVLYIFGAGQTWTKRAQNPHREMIMGLIDIAFFTKKFLGRQKFLFVQLSKESSWASLGRHEKCLKVHR